MKCQNVGIGDALYHSIKAAASKMWPAFGKQSKIIVGPQGKRFRVAISMPRSVKAIRGAMDLPRGFPSFETVELAASEMPGLPPHIWLDYNERVDVLLVALPPGGVDEPE